MTGSALGQHCSAKQTFSGIFVVPTRSSRENQRCSENVTSIAISVRPLESTQLSVRS